MSAIRKIGMDDFLVMLGGWIPQRHVDSFHVHHTYKPRHRDFRGLVTMEAMRQYHMQQMGMRDIAQHLTIDPLGGIWTGRPFDMAPGSAVGHNGSSLRGPFMIEMVGDFDRGQDVFQGDQKRVALAVVVSVLKKFGLGVDSVRFHNEFTAHKSCPGTGIDLKAFRKDVSELLSGASFPALTRVSDALHDPAVVRSWTDNIRNRLNQASSNVMELESRFAEPPEDDRSGFVQEYIADCFSRGYGWAQTDGVETRSTTARAPLEGSDVLPYVINLSRGLLSSEGEISTGSDPSGHDRSQDSTRSSLRDIVERHLPAYIAQCDSNKKQPHLLFYAHGGLVSEANALAYARSMAPWWLAHGVYPIFIVWESSLLETLLPSWAINRGAPTARSASDRLLEWITQGVARGQWSKMKRHARDGSRSEIEREGRKPGGLSLFADLLKPLLAAQPNLKLHAVGHSTGPILLSSFLPLLANAGHTFKSLSYLAPAMRIDDFVNDVLPLIQSGGKANSKIDDFKMYTMSEDAEKSDNVLWAYRKSLLYYVREACEDEDDGRILGLQQDVFADTQLRKLFGVPAAPGRGLSFQNASLRVGVEFSPPHDSGLRNPLTSAVSHGCFDNNADTMFAVLARVLGNALPLVVATPEQQFPSGKEFKKCSVWGAEPDLADEARAWRDGADQVGFGSCPCCNQQRIPGHFGDDPDPDGVSAPESAAKGNGVGILRNRRLALCVGIDAYASNPLAGCVADSQLWARQLCELGYEVDTLVDAQATRAGILQGLRRLLTKARPGDELVFQYAGHGSQVQDSSGDEKDGMDEVFVPFDFTSGALLIDDDLYNESLALPSGAHLTLFMDCCHSGSNSRVAPLPRSHGDERPRFLRLPSEVVHRYLEARAHMTSRFLKTKGEQVPPPGVLHFAACRDDEYAWESNGQGDFTRLAVPLLAEATRLRWNNRQYADAVEKAFKKNLKGRLRQHPMLLRPAGGLDARILLGST